jgi:hypothetical protein
MNVAKHAKLSGNESLKVLSSNLGKPDWDVRGGVFHKRKILLVYCQEVLNAVAK